MSRRQDDAQNLVDALDGYIEMRFGIQPRMVRYEDREREEFVTERIVKAIMKATEGRP